MLINIMNILPKDFDINAYSILNDDLRELSNNELLIHYFNNGYNENRQYKFNLPDDFNPIEYKNLNNDLINFNNIDLKRHYMLFGFNENRNYKYNCNNINNINDILLKYFDVTIYRSFNKDLNDLTDDELINHFINYGYNENRLYNINIKLPNDFNINAYRYYNEDLTNLSNKELINHYLFYGKNENRLYKYDIDNNFNYLIFKIFNSNANLKDEDECKSLSSSLDSYIYTNKYIIKLYILFIYGINNENIDYSLINDKIIYKFAIFLSTINIKLVDLETYIMINLYNKLNNNNDSIETTYQKLLNNNKENYRYLCYRNINLIKNIPININYNKEKHNETVFIEFRILYNIEFNIRNMCIKLPNWKHTIICGSYNYDFIIKICKNISDKINIINIDIDNLNIDDYSILLTSEYFWNLLTGKYILIHQEDSLIFNNNIDKWLKYDYVGAPWPHKYTNYPEKYLVGNGGFSLRNREIMKQICTTYDIRDYPIFDFTKKYMYENNLNICPEDCFYVKCMVDNNIGNIPNYNDAIYFSIESIYSKECTGGHCFWICDNDWKNRIKSLINSLNNTGLNHIKLYEHRFGWSNLLLTLYINDIISINNNNNDNIQLIDLCEKFFIWDNNKIYNKKWIGILHLTPTSPIYIENINNLLNNKNFIDELPNCNSLIFLSKYLRDYVISYIENNYNIKINSKIILHPIYNNNNYFNLNNYIISENKFIIQIGIQYRILSTFINCNFNTHKKIWLTGTKNNNRVINELKNELNVDTIDLNNYDIEIKYVNNNEYDNLINNNILFIHLYDASANNAIVEAIACNIPILVNRHIAVVEYLGENYPLYFNNPNEINDNFINIEKIKETYHYLCNMDKSKFKYSYFMKELVSIYN
jgi:hypothetical protein